MNVDVRVMISVWRAFVNVYKTLGVIVLVMLYSIVIYQTL